MTHFSMIIRCYHRDLPEEDQRVVEPTGADIVLDPTKVDVAEGYRIFGNKLDKVLKA